MDRGFTAVRAKLAELPDGADLGAVAKTVGMTLISTVGGASGPLYGTFFLRAGHGASARRTPSTRPALGAALRAGLEGLVQRGKAELDDKTMVDAVTPGRRRLRRRGRATASRAGARRRRGGGGRGARPGHAARRPQGTGELPRRAVGGPPGPRRDLHHHHARIAPRRGRGELIATIRAPKGRKRSTWPSTSSPSTRARPRAEPSSSTPTAPSTRPPTRSSRRSSRRRATSSTIPRRSGTRSWPSRSR